MNDKAKGYLLGVIASASYGMNPLFALPLYQSGMTPDEVLFYRYSLAIPILAVMIIARGRNFKIKKQEAGVLFFMGMVIAISSLTLFSSYNYMSVGIASTLLLSYNSRFDYDCLLQGEAKFSDDSLHAIGISRDRHALPKHRRGIA